MTIHTAQAAFGPDEKVLLPARDLNYNGDVRHMATSREIVGPNLLGEHLVAVRADFDDEAGKTRVGFGYLPRLELTDGVEGQVVGVEVSDGE